VPTWLVKEDMTKDTRARTGAHLVGEGAGHDKRGVAGGAAQVQQAALSQDDDTMAIGEDEAVTLGLDVLALDAGPAEHACHVDLCVRACVSVCVCVHA